MIRWRALVVTAALAVTGCAVMPAPRFPSEIAVNLHGPDAKHEETRHAFWWPVDLRDKRLAVTVQVPAGFVRRPFSAVQLWAKDAKQRWQNTTWTEGSISPENTAFDGISGTLTLSYTPTDPRINRQGWTAPGFDPAAGIREIGIKIGTPSAADATYRLKGTVRVLEAVLEPVVAPSQEAAVWTPLSRHEAGRPNGPRAPLTPGQLKTGFGRYFRYGDLHRWEEAASDAADAFRLQQRHGLTGFRLLAALDVRGWAGGLRVGPDEMQAMRRYLELARETGQRHHIVTLFDGAVPNAALARAISDPAAQAAFLKTLRPFIRSFGASTIDGEPVIFDLVNEIHGVGGVGERSRQRFVEALIELFIQEAPGATVTLGLADYRDLVYWLHLPRQFAGRPVTLLYTIHCYGDEISTLPPVWELNLPDGVEIGITEADAGQGMAAQLRAAAGKGYRWLLFWSDADYMYDPAQHRTALGRPNR